MDASPVGQAVQYDSAHPHWAWAHPQLAGLAGYHCVAAHSSYQYERFLGDPFNATQVTGVQQLASRAGWVCG